MLLVSRSQQLRATVSSTPVDRPAASGGSYTRVIRQLVIVHDTCDRLHLSRSQRREYRRRVPPVGEDASVSRGGGTRPASRDRPGRPNGRWALGSAFTVCLPAYALLDASNGNCFPFILLACYTFHRHRSIRTLRVKPTRRRTGWKTSLEA